MDETGFLKKGTKSIGVKRQYSGPAGRMENCQVGLFLAYRSEKGHAFLDRALYLLLEWADDLARRGEAKVPKSIVFATKPTLACQLLARALDSGADAVWVTADEVYGSDRAFRRFYEDRRLSYVASIHSATHLFLDGQRRAVSKYVVELPDDAWRRLSCGAGSKRRREYDWAFVLWTRHEHQTHHRGWLVRRSLSDSGELAFYFYAPQNASLQKLVEVAGSRWAVEECFEQAKQEARLDQYEVRSWAGWQRHGKLSMQAHATLAALRTHAADEPARKKTATSFR